VALAEMGRNEEAKTILTQMAEAASAVGPTYYQAQALAGLVAALIKTGHIAEADEIAHTIQDPETRTAALLDLGTALARARRFAQAFVAIGPCELDSFLHALSQWAPSFEQVEPGLTAAILKDAVRVAAWVQPYWRKTHRVLVEQGSMEDRELADPTRS
jgi:hypothetical protein